MSLTVIRYGLTLILICLLSGSAVAQSATHREKIMSLLGFDEITDLYALADSTIATMQREGLQLSDEMWGIFRKELILEGFNSMLDSTAILTGAYYTEADADTLLAFFNSSTGKKFLDEAAQLEPQLAAMRDRWIRPILYRTEERVNNLHQQRFNAVVDSCALHHTSTFLNLGSRGNAISIKRTADRQIELRNGVTVHALSVDWKGSCRYDLYSLTQDGTPMDEAPIRVNIYQAGKHDYRYIAWCDDWGNGEAGYNYGHIVQEEAYREWLQKQVDLREQQPQKAGPKK